MDALFRVSIPANTYDGRYYDYGRACVNVIAQNEAEATTILNLNKKLVLEYLHNRRTHTKRYLIPHRQSPERNVFFREEYYVEKGYGRFGLVNTVALFRDGLLRYVDMEQGGALSRIGPPDLKE
jgi:hypothetical protein